MTTEYRDLEDIKSDIMSRTSGGLDIFMELYPNAHLTKNFKIREEKTASTSLKQANDGNWVLTDYGGDNISKNAITAFAEFHKIEWVEACITLANRYSIPTGSKIEPAKPTFKEFSVAEFPHELNEHGYHFEFTDEFTPEELSLLGPFVDKDSCKKCNCYKVISMASEVVDKFSGAKKILQRLSNDSYPIFAFINKYEEKTFYKIYQPKSENKAYKFMFIGGRPKGFVNGMQRFVRAYQQLHDEWLSAKNKAAERDESFTEPEPKKIENVIICSGERDALNMTSMGFYAVWHNSETAEWTKRDIKKLYDNAQEVINIPDLDETGIRQGRELAERYLSIKTLWLPKWIKDRKDHRGNGCKDLTDYFNLNRQKNKQLVLLDIKSRISKALPLQFWDSTVTDKGIRWSFSNTLMNNFLHHFGFYRLEIPGNKNGWIFIQIKGHLVEKVDTSLIFKFIDDFLDKRNLPLALRDLAITSTNLSESKLARIKPIELNFTNFSKTHQTFSFSHETWRVDKNGIHVADDKNANYTWSNDVIDRKISDLRGIEMDTNKIKILPDFFKVKKTNGFWDIDILEKNCDFFNFIINISRVYWKDEFIDSWLNEKNNHLTVEKIYEQEDNKAYREEHKFSIDGPRLSEDQIREQKHHLVNKLYAIGYLLHSYKDEGNAWAVFAMENDVIDDTASNGGSGKSLFTKSFNELLESVTRPANSKDVFDDRFLYDGVTEHTQLFVFNDADRYFNMRELYSQITEDLYVNPKNGTPYSVLYKDSPKFAISSNFALRETNQSTLRRLLLVATSNFYHYPEPGFLPGRQPADDYNGKRFFQEWDVEQYNMFLNFYMQCLKFYLNTNEKINPPMNSITLRNLTAQIGKHFMDFADEFFIKNHPDENGMVEYNKSDLRTEVQNYHKSISGMSSTAVSSNMEAYCKLKGYEWMPGRDRYQKSIDGKLIDYVLIFVGKPKDTEDAADMGFPF